MIFVVIALMVLLFFLRDQIRPTKQETHVVTIEEDDYGNLIIPLPDTLLEQLGWRESDMVVWTELDDGTFLVEKASS